MCHHRVDVTEQADEHRRATEEEGDEAEVEADAPAVEFELDRDYEERDAKTPGDD